MQLLNQPGQRVPGSRGQLLRFGRKGETRFTSHQKYSSTIFRSGLPGKSRAFRTPGSRYQDFRAFPDGSVAYPAPGSSATKVKILRMLGCGA